MTFLLSNKLQLRKLWLNRGFANRGKNKTNKKMKYWQVFLESKIKKSKNLILIFHMPLLRKNVKEWKFQHLTKTFKIFWTMIKKMRTVFCPTRTWKPSVQQTYKRIFVLQNQIRQGEFWMTYLKAYKLLRKEPLQNKSVRSPSKMPLKLKVLKTHSLQFKQQTSKSFINVLYFNNS